MRLLRERQPWLELAKKGKGELGSREGVVAGCLMRYRNQAPMKGASGSQWPRSAAVTDACQEQAGGGVAGSKQRENRPVNHTQ